MALLGCSGLHPPAKELDPLGRPRPVAGHRPGTQALEDCPCVRGDLLMRPEIEREAHRVAVDLAEEGLNVLREADRLVNPGKLDRDLGFLVRLSGW
jgi:hypothetical protein